MLEYKTEVAFFFSFMYPENCTEEKMKKIIHS